MVTSNLRDRIKNTPEVKFVKRCFFRKKNFASDMRHTSSDLVKSERCHQNRTCTKDTHRTPSNSFEKVLMSDVKNINCTRQSAGDKVVTKIRTIIIKFRPEIDSRHKNQSLKSHVTQPLYQ